MKAKKKSKGKTKPRGKAKKARAAVSTSSYWATAGNQKKPVKQRIAALSRLPSALCDDRTKFSDVLAILRDTTQAAALRYAALQTVQSASFSAPNFESCRPDYLATLRSLVADPDFELRQRVLGLLAREHDGSTQRLLVDGLKEPSRALLPAEKALQLLGYDIHTDVYAVARDIVAKPPSEAARLEALRLLAADTTSTPMFESLLRNKKEPAQVRRLAATALQALEPEKLQGHAHDIVQDDSEDDDVRATSLTALTDLGQAASITDALYERVDKLKSKSKSGAIKKSARRFIEKYRR